MAFQRRWQRQVDAYERGEICFDELTASVQGWANHARYGNTVGLRKAMISSRVIKVG